MLSWILLLAAAVVIFLGEVVGGVDFAHVPWSLFLAYLGLAAKDVVNL